MEIAGIFLFTACVFDYFRRRIPNVLIITYVTYGLIYEYLSMGIGGVGGYIWRLVMLVLIMFPLFRVGVLGAGDIKISAVTAAFLPLHGILYFYFYSLLIASVISVIILVKNHCLYSKLAYLMEYVKVVFMEGRINRYAVLEDASTLTICLSGPFFFSFLLHMGGVY